MDIRRRFEDIFEMTYTGWTGRYYDELDTLKNGDIPKWMIRLHYQTHQRGWKYEGPGIVYVHEDSRVIVLEASKDLIHEIPILSTEPRFALKYGVPEYIRYPFWFDIVKSHNPANTIANYKVHYKERGDSILSYYNIPKSFPAVIGDSSEELRYYFCGDFSDNPVGYYSSFFKGIPYLRKLLYNNQDYVDRRKFFWEYYRPIVEYAMNDYLKKSPRIDRELKRPIPENTSRKTGRRAYIARQQIVGPKIAPIESSTLRVEPSDEIKTNPYGRRKLEGVPPTPEKAGDAELAFETVDYIPDEPKKPHQTKSEPLPIAKKEEPKQKPAPVEKQKEEKKL